jgi:hypothetical protein
LQIKMIGLESVRIVVTVAKAFVSPSGAVHLSHFATQIPTDSVQAAPAFTRPRSGDDGADLDATVDRVEGCHRFGDRICTNDAVGNP